MALPNDLMIFRLARRQEITTNQTEALNTFFPLGPKQLHKPKASAVNQRRVSIQESDKSHGKSFGTKMDGP